MKWDVRWDALTSVGSSSSAGGYEAASDGDLDSYGSQRAAAAPPALMSRTHTQDRGAEILLLGAATIFGQDQCAIAETYILIGVGFVKDSVRSANDIIIIIRHCGINRHPFPVMTMTERCR